MGGGDLNLKKAWHTQKMVNIEKVWLAEQKRLKEEQTIEQLKKERKEDRERQELLKLQEQAGLIKPRLDRVEWLYNNQGIKEENDSKEREDYLLGRKRIDEKTLQSKEADDGKALTGFKGSYLSEKFNDQWQPFTGITPENEEKVIKTKIREDPLFAIKKKEKEMLDQLVRNPLKLKEVQRSSSRHDRREQDEQDYKAQRKHRESDRHSYSRSDKPYDRRGRESAGGASGSDRRRRYEDDDHYNRYHDRHARRY
jgi:hypothetical protein